MIWILYTVIACVILFIVSCGISYIFFSWEYWLESFKWKQSIKNDIKTKKYLDDNTYYIRDGIMWKLIRDNKTLEVSMSLFDIIKWYRTFHDPDEKRRSEYTIGV